MNSQAEQTSSVSPKISAVVVTYLPDVILLENLRKILAQVSTVIVVDNGSDGASAEWVELAGKLPGVFLIRNLSNLGIADALNIGIRHALQTGCQWVATFDQDTAIPVDYFNRLFRSYEKCPISESVGVIVSGGWSEGDNAAVAGKYPAEPGWSLVSAAVNSGSLIKTGVFEKAGFYDKDLFIDYVDADFCLRVQKNGFKILSATGVVLEHDLGTKQTRNLLGLRLSFRIHAAWRYYYIMRNRLMLYRRYFTTFPRWVMRDALGLSWELPRIILLEHGRGQKLSAVVQGISDGLRGKTGRHPHFPPT